MAKEIDVSYGKKLKLLRINQFKTQKNMAIKFKMSQQGYSDMEKGKTRFTDAKIKKICKIFNTSFQEFVTTNTKQRKVQTKQKDSYVIGILKHHYEIKLLEQKIKIRQLEVEVRKLLRIKAMHEEKR